MKIEWFEQLKGPNLKIEWFENLKIDGFNDESPSNHQFSNFHGGTRIVVDFYGKSRQQLYTLILKYITTGQNFQIEKKDMPECFLGFLFSISGVCTLNYTGSLI